MVDYAKGLKLTDCYFSIMTPLPGSRLYDEAQESGELLETDPTASAVMSPEELEVAVARLLVAADQADETEDHVVEKCLGCGLAMDGSPDHVVVAHGYEIHFCSPSCTERADEDIDEAILALGELEEPATEATN